MSQFFELRNVCPACESKQLTELYRQPYSSETLKNYLHNFYSEQGNYDYTKVESASFVLAQCNTCTCVFQTEIPNNALMQELYEEWLNPGRTFQLYEQNYGIGYYTPQVKKAYRYIQLFKKNPKQIKVLDFGMGWGNWLQIMKAFGCSVYGSELSAKRIEHATANGITNIDYNSFSDYQFDFINTDQVFEHVPNPKEILQHLVKCLSPTGYLRICVPDGNNISNLLGLMDWDAKKHSANSLNVVAPLEHINCFTTKSLLVMAERYHLEPVYLPDYPRLDEAISPPLKTERIRSITGQSIGLIKDILRPVYSKLKDDQKIEFSGTDLLFRLKRQAGTHENQ